MEWTDILHLVTQGNCDRKNKILLIQDPKTDIDTKERRGTDLIDTSTKDDD